MFTIMYHIRMWCLLWLLPFSLVYSMQHRVIINRAIKGSQRCNFWHLNGCVSVWTISTPAVIFFIYDQSSLWQDLITFYFFLVSAIWFEICLNFAFDSTSTRTAFCTWLTVAFDRTTECGHFSSSWKQWICFNGDNITGETNVYVLSWIFPDRSEEFSLIAE